MKRVLRAYQSPCYGWRPSREWGVLDRIWILLVLLGAVCCELSRLLASPTAEVLNAQDKIDELEIMKSNILEKLFRSPQELTWGASGSLRERGSKPHSQSTGIFALEMSLALATTSALESLKVEIRVGSKRPLIWQIL
jgi:hypothetical protein